MGRPALPRRPLVVALAAAAAALALVGRVAGADAPVVTVTQVLAGLNDTTAGGYEPPDVQVAAGPGHVVEMVNLAERVWRTGGGSPQLTQTRSLAALFRSGQDRLTDPRVLYDRASGRWFATIANVEARRVLLAVSQGGDPTGGWTVAAYAAAGCPDQPRLGVADGVVVLAADVFDACGDEGGSANLGNELWVVNKQQLVAGSASAAFTTLGPTADYASVAPVQSLSPTTTEYAVALDDNSSDVVHLLAIDGVPPGPVALSEAATPTIRMLARPPSAAQPPAAGRRPPLETNDNRVLDSAWENGRLWLTANARCLPPGDALIRSCARVVEVDTATGAVTWDADLGSAGAHVFFGAVRPDGRGNLVVVAGRSGTTILPQLVAFGRTADGAVTAPTVIAQGAGVYRGGRYGDYFGAAADPVDPSVVWVAGEAGADVPTGGGWTTAVASVVVTAAGAAAPASASAPPPGVRAVSAAKRVGARVQLAYLALDDGTSVRVVVTVRRGGAVLYRTSTGRITLRAEQRYTVLWPAKQVHGPLSYCVGTVSSTGAASPESCVRIAVR